MWRPCMKTTTAFFHLVKSAECFATGFNRFLDQWFNDRPLQLKDCKTPEDLRRYARSIEHTHRGMAQDIFAAANRAEKAE